MPATSSNKLTIVQLRDLEAYTGISYDRLNRAVNGEGDFLIQPSENGTKPKILRVSTNVEKTLFHFRNEKFTPLDDPDKLHTQGGYLLGELLRAKKELEQINQRNANDLEEIRDSYEEEIERIKNELKHSAKQIEQLSIKEKTLKADNSKLQKQLAAQDDRRESVSGQVREFANRLEEAELKNAELTGKINQLQTELDHKERQRLAALSAKEAAEKARDQLNPKKLLRDVYLWGVIFLLLITGAGILMTFASTDYYSVGIGIGLLGIVVAATVGNIFAVKTGKKSTRNVAIIIAIIIEIFGFFIHYVSINANISVEIIPNGAFRSWAAAAVALMLSALSVLFIYQLRKD